MFLFNPFFSWLGQLGTSAVCESTRNIIPKHYNPTLYTGYEARRSVRRSITRWGTVGLEYQLSALRCMRYLGNPFTRGSEAWVSALLTMTERLGRDYHKPHFGIDDVVTSDGPVEVTEELVFDKPFGSLLHFRRDTRRKDPRVLLVAPMSGHYSTLLRETVRTLLSDHEVYLTDWHNARDIPSEEGTFGFDDYVQYIVDFMQVLGPNTHMLAVCQPTVPSMVATALMEADNASYRPASLTLMGGPIDTAAAPTEVTRFADRHNIDWFEKNVIAQVPYPYHGSGRLVYPGFLQLTGFISMNPEKHYRSHLELFQNLFLNEYEASEKTAKFYDEYLAVCDLPARFYLETIDRVFLRQDLARESMLFRGEPVNCKSVTRTPLLTVEGENDDISAPGQTLAAHTIFSELPSEHRFHHLQKGVGHYGLFSGRRWRKEISPRITSFIRKFDQESMSEPSLSTEMNPFTP